jgi:spore germination protein YaaH
MRILITKEGNTIIQEIDDSYPNIPQMTTNFNRGYSTGHQLRNKEFKQNLIANKFSLTNDKIGNFSKILNNKIPKNLKKSKIKLFRNISNINMEDIEITKDEIK